MNNFDNRRREVSMALQKAEAALGRAEDGAGQEGRGHDVRFQLRLLAVSLRGSFPYRPHLLSCTATPRRSVYSVPVRERITAGVVSNPPSLNASTLTSRSLDPPTTV